ncbi:hypothetical protein QUA79_19045 [Microcoleus sp. F8-D1]
MSSQLLNCRLSGIPQDVKNATAAFLTSLVVSGEGKYTPRNRTYRQCLYQL